MELFRDFMLILLIKSEKVVYKYFIINQLINLLIRTKNKWLMFFVEGSKYFYDLNSQIYLIDINLIYIYALYL